MKTYTLTYIVQDNKDYLPVPIDQLHPPHPTNSSQQQNKHPPHLSMPGIIIAELLPKIYPSMPEFEVKISQNLQGLHI